MCLCCGSWKTTPLSIRHRVDHLKPNPCLSYAWKPFWNDQIAIFCDEAWFNTCINHWRACANAKCVFSHSWVVLLMWFTAGIPTKWIVLPDSLAEVQFQLPQLCKLFHDHFSLQLPVPFLRKRGVSKLCDVCINHVNKLIVLRAKDDLEQHK